MKINDPNFKSVMLKITAVATFCVGVECLFLFKAVYSNMELLASTLKGTPTSGETQSLLEMLKSLLGVFPWQAGYLFFISIVIWLCSLKSKSSGK
jgi:hypothetical protein